MELHSIFMSLTTGSPSSIVSWDRLGTTLRSREIANELLQPNNHLTLITVNASTASCTSPVVGLQQEHHSREAQQMTDLSLRGFFCSSVSILANLSTTLTELVMVGAVINGAFGSTWYVLYVSVSIHSLNHPRSCKVCKVKIPKRRNLGCIFCYSVSSRTFSGAFGGWVGGRQGNSLSHSTMCFRLTAKRGPSPILGVYRATTIQPSIISHPCQVFLSFPQRERQFRINDPVSISPTLVVHSCPLFCV